LSTSVALPRTRGAQPSSVLLDPRRLLRSVYLGRLAIAGAIFLAAVFVWREADRSATLVASLLVTGAMVFTGTSAIFSESRRVPLTRTFLETQALFDLVIVTTIVHITGGDVSQFAALYILLIAFYALLLSAAGGLLVSAAACVLYFGDVILGHEAALNLALWLQLGLFATVAITSGYIAARLREARDVREELTAELEKVRLQATDILRNIRSGIITVDSGGALVYANPAAIALLGISLQDRVGSHVLSTLANVSPTLAGALERAATEGVRTIRAEGTVSHSGRRFPIGLNTTFTSHG
jgi:two-component system sensor histidine kinase PilS (NtrC family)